MDSHDGPLERLIQECLPTLLTSQPGQPRQETQLSHISLDRLEKWRTRLPFLFSEAVEARTNGVQTIREASHKLHFSQRLNRGVYLMRRPMAETSKPPFSEVDRATTVLFEINPYRSVLVAGI